MLARHLSRVGFDCSASHRAAESSIPADDAAAPCRGAAFTAFGGETRLGLRNGMTICGVTRSSGRRSPGVEALSRSSVGVCSRGPGLDASGAEAGALAAGAAVCARAGTMATASATMAKRVKQRSVMAIPFQRRRLPRQADDEATGVKLQIRPAHCARQVQRVCALPNPAPRSRHSAGGGAESRRSSFPSCPGQAQPGRQPGHAADGGDGAQPARAGQGQRVEAA